MCLLSLKLKKRRWCEIHVDISQHCVCRHDSTILYLLLLYLLTVIIRECCSDRAENQGHSYPLLPTFTKRTRLCRRAPRHSDSNEAMLGRGTGRKTFVLRRLESSEDDQQGKVSLTLLDTFIPHSRSL